MYYPLKREGLKKRNRKKKKQKKPTAPNNPNNPVLNTRRYQHGVGMEQGALKG